MASALRHLIALSVLLAAQAGAAAAPADMDTTGAVTATEVHELGADHERIELARRHLLPGSFVAVVDGVPWERGADYRLDERRGMWLPLRRVESTAVAVLRYRYIPAPVPLRRELHPPAPRPSLDGDGSYGSATVAGDAATTAWGDLDVTGSKSVRMSSGSRREMTVDQTLRLNVSGRLTEDVSVRAMLSDDNLPVVPEGNTEELRDIDRVRVDVTGRTWAAVLGDFVARSGDTRYGGYRRKLQGARVSVDGAAAGVEVLAGAPRGRYRTVQLRGEESNQGPYPLAGNVGDNLFLVAGSERVTLDGELLTRGADRDYVVDYVRGTVTFTYRRLVTAESEIVVEFEEGEGPYARSVAGAGVSVPLSAVGVDARVGVRLFQESDDPDRPRGGDLSDEDRDALAAAGDDPDAATASGITPTAPGEGRYRLEETGGVQVAVWDTVAGDVDVVFFHVGSGLGEYAVESLTATGEAVYGYRGPGGGSWRIGRRLELASRQRLMSVSGALGDSLAPWLDAEWHASDFDANVLSSLDAHDDRGTAWRAGLRTGNREATLAGRSLGRWRASVDHEDLGEGFRPFLLARDLFRYERWGLGVRARDEGFLDQRDAVTTGRLGWEAGRESRSAAVEATWDRLDHGAGLEATALEVGGRWRLGAVSGRHARVDAGADDAVDPLDVTRTVDDHGLTVDLGPVRTTVGRLARAYRDGGGDDDTGARLRRWTAALASDGDGAWSWRAGWARDLADSARSDGWRRERDARTVDAALTTPEAAGMRLTADGTWRRTDVPGGAELVTRLAKLRLSGRWPDAGSDWALSYGIDNSRTEVLDRQVIYVGERQGDYNQAGDFVGHELGDHQVITVGTDSLVATTEVSADLTWRQDFSVLGEDRWWGAWSTFARVSARGRSRTDDVGGLLRLDRGRLLDPDDGVLGELSLRQDVNLLRHLRAWDLRLRLEFDEGLDRQYAAHPERRLRRLHQATLVRNLGQTTSMRWRTRRDFDRRRTEEAASSSNRSYGTVVWKHETEALWRPSPGNQAGIAVDHLRRSDDVSGVAQREWGLRPSARWRLADRWSGTVDARWSDVTSDEPVGSLRPFFFPYPGGNVDVSARLTWDPSRTLSVSLAQFSRRLGDERGWQHDVRLESTARF